MNFDAPVRLAAVRLEDLLPHRAPMLLLDKLEGFSSEAAQATMNVTEENPFVRVDGLLERAAYPELLAQCLAAGAGAARRAAGHPPPNRGYLAALRHVMIYEDARLGDALRIAVRLTARLGQVMAVEGEVRKNGRLLAAGTFKVFLPEAA